MSVYSCNLNLLFAQDIFLYWAESYLKQEATFIVGHSFDWIFFFFNFSDAFMVI